MARGNLSPFGFGSQRGDPFQLLRREMEQLFDNVGSTPGEASGGSGNIVAPRMDISEDDQAFKVSAEMPGARPEDVEVMVEDDLLTIRAERTQERETNRRNYHLVERSVGVFQRSLRLPAPVDAGKVQASFDNGVLTEECVQLGDPWVHLRLCLVCGHVGCCDSSKNRHATRHFQHTGHPLIRSLEPGERWVWCHADNAVAGVLAK